MEFELLKIAFTIMSVIVVAGAAMNSNRSAVVFVAAMAFNVVYVLIVARIGYLTALNHVGAS